MSIFLNIFFISFLIFSLLLALSMMIASKRFFKLYFFSMFTTIWVIVSFVWASLNDWNVKSTSRYFQFLFIKQFVTLMKTMLFELVQLFNAIFILIFDFRLCRKRLWIIEYFLRIWSSKKVRLKILMKNLSIFINRMNFECSIDLNDMFSVITVLINWLMKFSSLYVKFRILFVLLKNDYNHFR
jgi:hypothetical protein